MIELTKKYKTRDGQDVRLYAIDGRGDCPVHGAIEGDHGWIVHTWCNDGLWAEGVHALDLIECKPRIKREVWLNVYPDSIGDCAYNVRKRADESASGSRIACVKLSIDCEEGEGL